jgi:hypothetical protein
MRDVETKILQETKELRSLNEAYQSRIVALQDELSQDRDTIAALNAVARRPTVDYTWKHQQSIPDPPCFDGTRARLRPFLAQLRMKVAGDGHRFTDALNQIRYAAGLLEGLVLDQILPLIKDDNSISLPDLKDFCQLLENAFGDPDRRATAERQLERLRQANREYILYYADFQLLIADVEWNDGAKRHSLMRGLSTELKDFLVTVDIPVFL